MVRLYTARAIRISQAIVAAATAGHAAVLGYGVEGPLLSSDVISWFAVSLAPYLLAFALVAWPKLLGTGLAVLAGTLAVELGAYWSVFMAPTQSTAPLALVFAPIWQLAIALPLGVFGFAIDAALTRRWLDRPSAPEKAGLERLGR